jgi:rubredoxin-NAD+ reductase
VIGAGLIGCEYSNDLLNGGHQIQVVDALSTCLPTLAPEAVGRAIQSSLESNGVIFRFGTTVSGVHRAGDGVLVYLANGETLEADLVVSAIGVRPSTELARQNGIKVNRGICTDRYLQSSARHVYAMGDCAEVEGLVLVYVAPLMAQARALAKTLTGEETAVSYPPMPVTVKVPACPTVVAPPAKDLAGDWVITADGSNIKAEFRNDAGDLCGFAVTGSYTGEKRQLQAQLPPLLP